MLTKKEIEADKHRSYLEWRNRLHQDKLNRRYMGYIPLNIYSDGHHAHHLDNNYVIYIPKDIHNKIKHTLKNPSTMKEINMVSWCYLEASTL